MGVALARALFHAGYSVRVGSRRPVALAPRFARTTITTGTWQQVAESADLVILSLLWSDTADLPALAPALAGKVVVTCTNPETGGGLAIAPGTSGAEAVAVALPGSRVVAAFNHVYAELLTRETRFDGGTPTVLVAGDDNRAKAAVVAIINRLGLDPVEAGPLANAGLIEAIAELMVHLVRTRGFGPEGIALRLMYRDDTPVLERSSELL